MIKHAKNAAVFERGRKLGATAFAAGIKSAPAFDPHCRAALREMKPGETIDLLDGWNRGWHEANVAAAPVDTK